MIIHTDGINESQRILCTAIWRGETWKCIGRYINVNVSAPFIELFASSLPGLEQENGPDCFVVKAAGLSIREDPSGEAAWICDDVLDIDGRRKTSN